jgi:hypothetical protein
VRERQAGDHGHAERRLNRLRSPLLARLSRAYTSENGAIGMNMSSIGGMAVAALIDLCAVSVLAFGLYFPRHHRRDLALSFVAVNIGVFGVVVLLSEMKSDGLALGFGLFGVLSIVRLRSSSIQQDEVGYYFITLVLGLMGGLAPQHPFAAPLLDGLLLLVLYVVDHPRLLSGTRHATITLDVVHQSDEGLRADLERRLGGTVQRWVPTSVDYVQDIMVVDVRYRVLPDKRHSMPACEAPTMQVSVR